MPKLSEMKPSTRQSVVVFGPPKSGKTELMGGLSEKFNLIWFDLENGIATLHKLPQEQKERITAVTIPDTKAFPIAIQTMLKVITGVAVDICEKHGSIGCMICKKDGGEFQRICLNECGPEDIVCIDSGTALSSSAMNHITKNQNDDYKIEWEDYRKQGTLLDRFLSEVQQARFNVVIATHELEVDLEDKSKKLVPLFGTSNYARNSAKFFGHVVYCTKQNNKHKFASATTYSNNVLTGSRTDITIEGMERASLIPIFEGKIGSTVKDDAGKAGSILAGMKAQVGGLKK